MHASSFRLIDTLELNTEALRLYLISIQKHYREVTIRFSVNSSNKLTLVLSALVVCCCSYRITTTSTPGTFC